MPPQQIDVTPEDERDAAAFRLDPIALAKSAMDDALAAARVNASIATPDDALPEADAARPRAASARCISSLLQRFWRAFGAWRRRERLRDGLLTLSDRELMDIGLTRADIDSIAPQRAIDTLRDRTVHLLGRMM
jgi:uncharacterized protein YjiS (DUF1127 family)